MKGIRDAVALALVLVLQSTVVSRLGIGGVRPDLLVAFVVYFGWMRGPIAGSLGGFGIGLIEDLDASGPLGLNALCKTVVGFLVAKAGFRVHRSNVAVRFAFFSLAMLAHDLVYFAVTSLGDPMLFLKQIVWIAVPSAVLTAIVALLLLGLVERFTRRPLLADEI